MGGGGDTSSTSTQQAEFPPEFRPLAEGAVNQILGVQQALPIAGFAGFSPRGIAPLSSLQQRGLSLIESLLRPTAGLQGLSSLAGPVAQAAQGAALAGGPSSVAQQAISQLGFQPSFQPAPSPFQFTPPPQVPSPLLAPGGGALPVTPDRRLLPIGQSSAPLSIT